MATIALYAGKINQLPGMINNVKKSVTDYKSELSALKTKTLTVSRSVCSMEDVASSIQSSSQTQERKLASLETFRKDSEAFISDVIAIDSEVAYTVRQHKEDFYKRYAYLKPDCERSGWERFKDGLKKTGEWCKEHWKLIATVVIAIAAVVVCVFFPAAIPFVLEIAKGALLGALSGGLIGGGISALLGESFWEGFKEGAFMGAVFGGIGGAGKAFAGCCKLINALGGYKKVFHVIAGVAKISGAMSFAMGGFDMLSLVARLFNPASPLAAFNEKMHSNALYNGIQFIVRAVAAFSGGAYIRMRQGPPVCFVAGTMILTAAGMTAIENIRAGDRVISTNPDTFETGERTVLETYIRKVRQLVHLTVNGKLVSTTANHPFWVKGKGFVSAGELRAGDELASAAAGACKVENIRMEIVEAPEKVYNFQVEEFHTYYVGTSGVLVHNAEYGGKSDTGVKYSPVNPGPLKEDVANSFNGATYTERVLAEDTVMYRVSGGNAKEVGAYMSMTPQNGGLQSQLDLALNPAWGNTTENITKVVVPKGTTIYEGIAAPQNIYDSLGNVIGTLPGGGNQVYIPTVEAGWFK